VPAPCIEIGGRCTCPRRREGPGETITSDTNEEADRRTWPLSARTAAFSCGGSCHERGHRNGLRKPEIVYQKGLKRTEQLAELEDAVSRPATRVAGIVVDMVDEIVHGVMLGKRGIAGQINAWCETGFVEKLFLLLAEQGYQIYLTADHGNVDAEGIGRLSQGVVSELRGERVRTYRSETLAASVPSEIDAFRFDSPGLPPDFLPVYADTRGAFVPKGDQIVAHGGISVEELIVPFIKINIKRPAS